jgi:Domain of unknown function (DUF4340)
MSGNRLVVAVVVLGALLGLTLFLFNQRAAEDSGPTVVATVKLPALKKEDLDALEVTVPGKPKVKLTKQGDKWGLTEPVAAAADQSAVTAALDKLAELEVVGTAATKSENHATLEIDDAKAVRVTASKGGKPLLDLLIGGYRSGNTMARKHGEAVVATVKGSIKYAFDKDVRDWRDRSIVEVSADDITQITFENAGGVFKLVQEAGAWKQAPGEPAIPGFDPEQVKAIVASAASMNASDFAEAAPAGPEAPLGSVAMSVGTPGQRIVLRVGPKKGDDYLVVREGQAPVYLVSAFVAERLLPTADKFAKPADPAAPAADSGKPKAKVAKVPAK